MDDQAGVMMNGGQWDFDEAMRQYDIQQQRACKAEVEVAQLKRMNERTYCAYCEYEVPLAELDAREKVAAHIYECENHPLGIRVRELSAEVARLKELQPCSHSVQAIRSTPYIGDQHSNYCGWCADVEHEHELCQALTAELLAYREKVAWLREALKGYVDDHRAASYAQVHTQSPCDCRRCMKARTALSIPVSDKGMEE